MGIKVICDKCGEEIEGECVETMGKEFCSMECANKWLEERE